MKKIFLCMLSLSLLSCGDKNDDKHDGNLEQKGKYALKIETNVPTDIKNIVGEITTADFAVRVENPKSVIISKWERYDKVPTEVVSDLGEFIVYASKGDSTAQGFDKESYSGVEKFNVELNKTTDVKLVCPLNKVLISIKIDDALKGFYKDLYAEVKSATTTLRYAKNETRVGYFIPSDVEITLFITRKDDSVFEVKMQPMSGLKANEHHAVSVTSDSSEGSIAVRVTIEKENEVIKDVEIPYDIFK